jgi:hypothetical protein
VNVEALAHWGAVAPNTNKQTNNNTAMANYETIQAERNSLTVLFFKISTSDIY